MDEDESFDLIQRLISKGADVNAVNKYNFPALCKAVYSGNTEVARLLINNGADVNAVNDYGHTPIYYAARHGNPYKTVTIGTQVWMAENLKTTRYRNGDTIFTTTPATLDISNESTPKYQWAYAGNDSNEANYGRLYTWYTVTDERNICPCGWHVPSDAEWNTLTNFLGGDSLAQGKLKEAGTKHWSNLNTDATNESGFTALPGGNRWDNGLFLGLGDFTHWWTSSEYDSVYAWRRILVSKGIAKNYWGAANKKIGWFVRCVKD
jgi:uncharacterized protein (TIGR02145 family)